MQLNCLILCQLHVKNTAAVSEGRVDCWKSIMLYWSLCSACLTAVKKLLNNIQRGFKELFLLLSPNIEPLLFCHLPWPKHFWGRQKLYCGKNSNIHTQTRINHTLRVSLLITSEQMFPLLGPCPCHIIHLWSNFAASDNQQQQSCCEGRWQKERWALSFAGWREWQGQWGRQSISSDLQQLKTEGLQNHPSTSRKCILGDGVNKLYSTNLSIYAKCVRRNLSSSHQPQLMLET